MDFAPTVLSWVAAQLAVALVQMINEIGAMFMKHLPEKFKLRTSELDVHISLSPMPIADEHGRYRPQKKQPVISLTFSKNQRFVDQKLWGDIICEATEVELATGVVLGIEDLEQIDEEGWDIFFKYGLYPTELFLKGPSL